LLEHLNEPTDGAATMNGNHAFSGARQIPKRCSGVLTQLWMGGVQQRNKQADRIRVRQRFTDVGKASQTVQGSGGI
jgi:hypothetical protein